MTITIEPFADYQTATGLSGTTLFERNDDLTGTLMRGEHLDMHHPASADGIVLLGLDIDREGFARVEAEPSSSLEHDNLATAELGLRTCESCATACGPSWPLRRHGEPRLEQLAGRGSDLLSEALWHVRILLACICDAGLAAELSRAPGGCGSR